MQAVTHTQRAMKNTGNRHNVPAASRPSAVVVRASARSQAYAQVVEEQRINVEALYARLEARAKAMIALEEQEVATRPKVKFTLPFRVGLGEGWKIVGKCPELGNMTPEVAPYMTWNNGDVWSLEARMRPGKFIYKAVLRKPDGQYLWEEGPDRVIEIPYEAGAKNVFEAKIDNIKFPAY